MKINYSRAKCLLDDLQTLDASADEAIALSVAAEVGPDMSPASVDFQKRCTAKRRTERHSKRLELLNILAVEVARLLERATVEMNQGS